MTGTITITTLLFFYIAAVHWRKPMWLVAIGAGALLSVDLLFLAANLTKLTHGAWLPILIGLLAFTVLTTWQRGRTLVTHQREELEGSLRDFVDQIHQQDPPVQRVPGTAVFLNRSNTTAPLAMRQSVEHFHALHEHVVVLSLETQPVPHVAPEDRISIDSLGFTDDGITHVSARFGYMDSSDVPSALRLIDPADFECPLEMDEASYFLSTIELRPSSSGQMSRWRTALFIATTHITTDAALSFSLPRDRTIVMGSEIDV